MLLLLRLFLRILLLLLLLVGARGRLLAAPPRGRVRRRRVAPVLRRYLKMESCRCSNLPPEKFGSRFHHCVLVGLHRGGRLPRRVPLVLTLLHLQTSNNLPLLWVNIQQNLE